MSCIFNRYITINQLDSKRPENWGRSGGQNFICCTIAINVGQNSPKVRSVQVSYLPNPTTVVFSSQSNYISFTCIGFKNVKFHILWEDNLVIPRVWALRQARKSKILLAVIDYCNKCRPKGPLMLVTLKKFSSQSKYSWIQFPLIHCYIYVINSDMDHAYYLVD